MVPTSDTRELVFALLLVGGFSIAGFFTYQDMRISSVFPTIHQSSIIAEAAQPIVLVANPVVQIPIVEHNVFTSY